MNYKNKFITAISIPIIFNVVLFSIIFALLINYDHLQLKEYDYYDANKFIALPNMRLQAKGIINNVDFNSIILGSSMLANTSALEASQLFGGTFVNLSILGARTYERAFIFEDTFRHKKIKNVIYSLDVYHRPKEESSQLDNWQLLYDQSKLNDLVVLLQPKYIVGAMKKVLTPYTAYDFNIIDHIKISKKPLIAHIDFFNSPIEWMSKPDHVVHFGGLANWVENIGALNTGKFLLQTLPATLQSLTTYPKVNYESVNVEEEKQYIEKYFLRFVKEHPETKFYVVFPPYYRFYYARDLVKDGKYFMHQKITRFMVDAAKKYDNLYIYGFEDLAFLDDISNYMDITHYHSRFNQFMLEAMSKNEHRLTEQNVNAYIAKCEQLTRNFDIQKLYDESQQLLREYKLPTTWEDFLYLRKKYDENSL